MTRLRKEQLSVVLILGAAGLVNLACWIGFGYVVWSLR